MVRGSFVRVGAVVDCPSCHKRYRVTDSLVTHRIRSKAASPVEAEAVEAHEPSLPRMDEDGNVIGLSGLSEMMRDHPKPEPGSAPSQSMPKAARRGKETAGDSKPTPARYHAQEAERKRRRRSMYLLLGVLVGAVAVLGGGLILASRMADDEPSTAASDNGELGPGADPRVIATDAPMLHAHRLDRPQWAFINRPFIEMASDPDVRLTRESIATAPDGSRAYLARLLTDRRDLVIDGRVVLSLVDPEGNEVGRTKVGLTLLDANHPQDIRIPIAERFNDDRLQPVARVETQRREPESVFLDPENLRLTPIGVGRQSAVQVIAFNPLDETLDGIVFQITALDQLKRPIARWSTRWDQPVAPRQRVEFQTLTPLTDEDAPHHWRIEAAGR